MAGKRVANTLIDWATFAEVVPKEYTSQFSSLRAKNDKFVRRVAAYPEKLPEIDWNYYKTRITAPGMVENFHKSYTSVSVPYPGDQGRLAEIDAQEKTMKEEHEKLVKLVASEISQLKEALKVKEAMIPVSEMTMEEFYLAYPEHSIDPYNNPTLWPHEEPEKEYTKMLKETGKL